MNWSQFCAGPLLLGDGIINIQRFFRAFHPITRRLIKDCLAIRILNLPLLARRDGVNLGIVRQRIDMRPKGFT